MNKRGSVIVSDHVKIAVKAHLKPAPTDQIVQSRVKTR